MNPKLKNLLFIIISLALAGFFMWWAFRDLNFTDIWESLKKAEYIWVAAAGFFALLAYVLRAMRWNLLLDPMGYQISTENSFWSISFGYFMNLFVPRSGELARATSLYATEKVPVEKSFGTVVLERLIDLCFLGLFAIGGLLFHWDALLAFYTEVTQKKITAKKDPGFLENLFAQMGFTKTEQAVQWLQWGLALLVVLGLVWMWKHKKAALANFLKGLWEGMLSILKLKRKGYFIALSFGIWISYYFATYLICFALPETAGFTWTEGIFIIVVGTLGMIVPASGGVGAFHLALKYGISSLFLSKGLSAEQGSKVGMSYAILSHSLQTLVTLVMGLLSLVFIAKNKSTEAKK